METSGSKSTQYKSICPHLGLLEDRASRFSYPDTAHRCFATNPATIITLEHQSSFCFTERCTACPRFVEPAKETASAQAAPLATGKATGKKTSSSWRPAIWSLVGFLISLLVIYGVSSYSGLLSTPSPSTPAASVKISTATPTLTATPLPATVVAEATSTPEAVAALMSPTVTANSVPDASHFALSPTASDVGWLAGNEERGNHFGDSYLYAGTFEGQAYIGAFQFDLSSIPRGAPIVSASIQMTGLRDDRLAIKRDQSDDGVWTLRMLSPEINEDWPRHSYQEIFNAPAVQTLNPFLSAKDLDIGQTNVFNLTPDQIKILEDQIVDNEEPQISFRMEGPVVGPDNLFAWDTGHGLKTENNGVTLLLEVGLAPATPPPFAYVVVTSTPTPENVVTAAAMMLQITAEATRIGTATPVPSNMVTATPFPENLVIVPTPNPENAVTAQAQAIIATAEALTTGTPTPIPTNAVTATPTPSPRPSVDLGDSTNPIAFVLITSTPTPETVFAAATLSAHATAQAQSGVVPTPLPSNWVTPVVVTMTPTPENEATAQYVSAAETAMAFTTGTPTATPANLVIATATPAYVSIPFLLTPTPAAVITQSLPIPSALLDKVLFKSDREGDASIYVFDPKTGEVGRLTDVWPYQTAQARDAWSADQRFQVFTKDTTLYKDIEDIEGETMGRVTRDVPALYIYDHLYDVESQMTHFGIGMAYVGAWSPTSERVAFVSTDSGNDEIWTINSDGSDQLQLTHNTWEWDKSPSWSPDGKQIVFMSNRTGNEQLWVMNADGSDQRLLMGWDNWTPYNDSEPVWVKYLDPSLRVAPAPPQD